MEDSKNEETKEGVNGRNTSSIKIENWKEYSDFMEAHNLQLYGMNFPESLGEKLYYKLKHEIFDSSRFFEIVENQEESRFALNAKMMSKKNNEIFLVDHCWTFKLRQYNYFCETFPNVIERIYNMLKYANIKRDIKTEEEEQNFLSNNLGNYLDCDNKNLTSLESLELDAKFEALSLENNKLEDFNSVLELLTNKGSNIKAIWLEGNDFEETSEGYEAVLSDMFESLQLINRKFTKNADVWSLEFLSNKTNVKAVPQYDKFYGKDDFLDLSGRDPLKIKKLDLFSKFKEIKVLDIKDNNYQFDYENGSFTNQLFTFLSSFPSLESLLVDEPDFYSEESDSKDFISFFRSGKVHEYVLNILPNLKFINDYSVTKLVNPNLNFLQYHKECRVRTYMWKVDHTYRLVTSEKYDEDATWYINDEFGTSINHSDSANVAIFPFIFSPSNTFKDEMITYSILWPIKDIKKGDEIFRDFLTNISESQQRSSRLTCWFNTPKDYFFNKFYKKMDDYSSINYQNNISAFTNKLDTLLNNFDSLYESTFNFESLNNKQDESLKLTTKENVLTSLNGKTNDYLISNYLNKGIKIKVFSDLPYVRENVTSTHFEITDDITTADILWLNMDYFKLNESIGSQLKEVRFKNQFPFENVVTMKSHLADLIQSNMGVNPFLNLSYMMDTELAEIIGNFYYNEMNNFDNSWILKPINMSRSMDMIVTNNIEEIIRNVETGPKICQKYISQPLLLNKKKFDLRFIVVLKSLLPLEVYFYSKMFWVRSANKDFTMDQESLTDYEVHFTVMNYNTYGMQTIYDKNFVEYLQSNNIEWAPIYQKIKDAVRNIFLMAGKDCPQMTDPNSRAIYGLDVMIEENLEPKLLELNYSPDCTRACKFVPDFFNDIFSTLFLDNPQGVEQI